VLARGVGEVDLAPLEISEVERLVKQLQHGA
jgi:hypothetical protein